MHVLTPPSVEPISVEEAKLACRIDDDAFDLIIPGLIAAAREMAEHETGVRWLEQMLREELRDWPAADCPLRVRRPTAVAVSYWTGSAWQAFTGIDFGEVAGGTVVAPLTAWPELGAKPVGARVRIDVTTGGTADTPDAARAAVPAGVRLWITSQVAYWLRNPEAATDGGKTPAPHLGSLLDPWRTYG